MAQTSSTDINDIDDLLRILQERPDLARQVRQALLTQELLELPEVVARLADRVEQLTDRVDRLTARVDQLTARVDQLTARVDQFIAHQEEFNARFERFIVAQEAANAEQREFNQAQREFNRQVERRLSGLENRVGGLETQVGELNVRVGRVETQIGKLQGDSLEIRMQGKIHSLVYRHCGLTRTRILKGTITPLEQPFYDRLEDAVDRGAIRDDDIADLMATDMLLQARRRGGSDLVHLAVEVSRTVAERDLTRARERADLLAAAAQTEAIALVIGNFVAEPQRRQAETLGVTVIEEPED